MAPQSARSTIILTHEVDARMELHNRRNGDISNLDSSRRLWEYSGQGGTPGSAHTPLKDAQAFARATTKALLESPGSTMRKRHLLTLACICVVSSNVSAEETVKLDTDRKKLSYAIGVQVAQSLARQEVDLDPDAFSLAIEDMIAGREPRIPREEFQALLEKQRATMLKAQQEKSSKNLEASKAFLAANRKKEGVKELPSGLQYRVVKDGAGDQPKSTDTVSVNYRGTLIDGREFDSSTRTGQPAVFQVNSVIKGWQEALPLMKTGAKWQLFIPPELGYGERGAGGAIGPNEILIFDIDLLAVNPAKK